MAKTFHAQLLTPNGSLFDGDIRAIKVPGSSGNFEMLYDHAPIVSTLTIGKVEIREADGNTLSYAVSGGFVEMNDNRVTLLAEDAVESAYIDADEVRKTLTAARVKLKENPKDREKIQKEIEIAKNLQKVAE